ncbi:isoprenoid synthase domain-containing protein [Pseudomassariella vexata]|uniref:Terpene synthase n=1 Tax=Pseudomassariella vexata TaxID=1141098 RepID=A0A1Y2DE74_9PEZI|nr:isoprenoid synthase domain-containing protein [Pseudomassariella vexata]ORY57507.1 isoprenoid synthase domain-containing protein [Pseudomassariella vexata]
MDTTVAHYSPRSGNVTPPESPKALVKRDVTLFLPDTFSSFMSIEPRMNQHYKQVKAEADTWIASVLGYDEKAAHRNSRADFTYLVSFWAPNGDAEALRTLVDWQHWAFPWDDQFDEGHLKENTVAAAEEIIHMISLLDDSHPAISPDEYPIRYAFQVNWYRFRERSSPELQHRYKKCLKHYMLGCLGQVGARDTEIAKLGVQGYLKFRRGTIGAYPCFCLVEYAEGIKIPQSVLDHPSIQACQEVAVDLVLLDNDLLSYKKDLLEGEELNIINLIRAEQGKSLQEAVDVVGDMLDACYRRWYRALADMPIWGAEIDREVLRYLDGIRNVALGSLHWSFHTGRYFKGDEGALLRRTREMQVTLSE